MSPITSRTGTHTTRNGRPYMRNSENTGQRRRDRVFCAGFTRVSAAHTVGVGRSGGFCRPRGWRGGRVVRTTGRARAGWIPM